MDSERLASSGSLFPDWPIIPKTEALETNRTVTCPANGLPTLSRASWSNRITTARLLGNAVSHTHSQWGLPTASHTEASDGSWQRGSDGGSNLRTRPRPAEHVWLHLWRMWRGPAWCTALTMQCLNNSLGFVCVYFTGMLSCLGWFSSLQREKVLRQDFTAWLYCLLCTAGTGRHLTPHWVLQMRWQQWRDEWC